MVEQEQIKVLLVILEKLVAVVVLEDIENLQDQLQVVIQSRLEELPQLLLYPLQQQAIQLQ